MIFLILKNWRNRNKIRFTIEPSRFELSPNCSQVVKFLLNAEHAVNCEEEFTIEGCSIHYPIRELIWESKLKASVIKPTINFISNELIFNCFYGEAGDLSTEPITLMNKSKLPLPIVLKVEGEFSIFLAELKSCEKKVMFNLKAHESRKIFISFNSNLIKKSNAFCTYEGRVKAYSQGKLQCILKLIANMIYPEIELSTNDVQFTANVAPNACSFIISNPNQKLPASFQFSINDNTTKIVPIHEKRQENLLSTVQCLMRQKNSLRDKFFRDETIYYDADDRTCSSSADKVSETNDVDVTNKDILEHLRSITEKASENYYCNDESMTVIPLSTAADESFLLLSEMSGVLQAGESRLISLYFNGSREKFNLKTIIKCQVEGGKNHDIRIHMTTCSPNIVIPKTYFDISHQQRWQEIAINNVCLSNISPSSHSIKLIAEKHNVEVSELIGGYVKLSSRCQLNFTLDEEQRDLKFSVFAGCLPIFKSEFGVQIDEMPPIPITFYCKNSMPMITLLDVDCESINTIDKLLEYDCLREMYNNVVEEIRVPDEVVHSEDIGKAKAKIKGIEHELLQQKNKNRKSSKGGNKKSTIDLHSLCDDSITSKEFALLFSNKKGRVVWREQPQKMCSAKVLLIVDEKLEECGFTALDYPNIYPHAIEILHFIAQHGFARSLENNEILMDYKNIYNRHAVEKFHQMKKSDEITPKCNAVDGIVTIEALPFILLEYSRDLGEIKIDEKHEQQFHMYCHHRNNAPVAVAIRSAAYIPNFRVNFYQQTEINNLFKVTNYEEMLPPSQLLVDTQCESVKRCHSFDLIFGNIHTRSVSKTLKQRKEIHRIYNKKSSTKEREKPKERNPLILAEIIQQLPFDNDESRIVDFTITFTPSSDNYYDAVTFDEMIYLDIHLGPQIPLRITGKFNQSAAVDHIVDADF